MVAREDRRPDRGHTVLFAFDKVSNSTQVSADGRGGGDSMLETRWFDSYRQTRNQRNGEGLTQAW